MAIENETDFSVLNMVMARLWKSSPFEEPILTLEIIAGEYKGVVFSFKSFHVLPVQMEGGFIPTKYETEIHIVPATFPKGWKPDEAFDIFTSEILFKWLVYIHQNSLAPLLAAKTVGIQ